MAGLQYTEAVNVAQSVLRQSDPKLIVDGYWGTYTRGAYDKAPFAIQARVKAVLAAMGAPSPDDLTEMHRRLKSAGDANLISRRAASRALRGDVAKTAESTVGKIKSSLITKAEALQLINEAVRILNNPIVTVDLLAMKLDLEAAKVSQGGVVYYNTQAINRLGYRGLFQFSADGASWEQASKVIELPSFEGPNGWRNAFYNTLAAGAYAISNANELRRKGYRGPMTYNILYLAHNQGPTGAYKILSGQKKLAGLQSAEAIKVSKLALIDANAIA